MGLPPSSCSIERTVEWVDTDAAGHQHNSVILRWAEACEAQLFRELDLPDYFPTAPRVRQTVNFTAKLYFGQRVRTTIHVEEIGEKSLTLAFKTEGLDAEGAVKNKAAQGTVVSAHVAPGADHASAWPASIRERILAFIS
jgi:acyl-CoA thioester hydrolase